MKYCCYLLLANLHNEGALPLEVLDLVGEVESLRVEGKVSRHEFLQSTDTSSEQVLFS